MSIETELQSRSGSCCELCKSTEGLAVYTLPPELNESLDHSILACSTCSTQISDAETTEPNHWRCLNDSMWSEVPAVQVVAWRMLDRLKGEGWPQDLLDMMYLDEETLAWARSGADIEGAEPVKHVDSNGVRLQSGDSVVLIKDLDVKGSSLTAKRGTAVRNIRVVHDNAEHIEGRVEGQQIVILTKFVKKT